jgi:hypothetical protein
MIALLQLQTAIYNRLNGDGMLMAMVGEICDQIPEQANYPLLVIGDSAQDNIAADKQLGDICRINLNVYSNDSGRKQALQILDRAYGLLHLQPLTIASGQLLNLQVVHAETQYQAATGLTIGELQLRAIIAEG